MGCNLSSKITFAFIGIWLVAIILFSLFFATSGVKEKIRETFFNSVAPYEDDGDLALGVPSESMAMLSENKVSAECCPSTYSASNGSVCLTKDQLEVLESRGGNRTLDKNV